MSSLNDMLDDLAAAEAADVLVTSPALVSKGGEIPPEVLFGEVKPNALPDFRPTFKLIDKQLGTTASLEVLVAEIANRGMSIDCAKQFNALEGIESHSLRPVGFYTSLPTDILREESLQRVEAALEASVGNTAKHVETLMEDTRLAIKHSQFYVETVAYPFATSLHNRLKELLAKISSTKNEVAIDLAKKVLGTELAKIDFTDMPAPLVNEVKKLQQAMVQSNPLRRFCFAKMLIDPANFFRQYTEVEVGSLKESRLMSQTNHVLGFSQAYAIVLTDLVYKTEALRTTINTPSSTNRERLNAFMSRKEEYINLLTAMDSGLQVIQAALTALTGVCNTLALLE